MKLGVAYLHREIVSHSFMDSLWLMASYERARDNEILRWPVMSSPLGLPEARNLAVKAFLASDAEWLLFVDSDMGFRMQTYERLLACEKEAVGALCVGQFNPRPDGMGGYYTRDLPLLYTRTDGPRYVLDEDPCPEDKLVRTSGTGCGCILINRGVFQKMEADFGQHWYTRISRDDAGLKPLGEDISFCERLFLLGIPLFVHTGIRTTHHKSVYLGQDVNYV